MHLYSMCTYDTYVHMYTFNLTPNHTLLLRISGQCPKKKRGGKECPDGYPLKKYTDKWVCPKYMYDGNYYPQILSGSGYVMTRSVAKCLYEAALMLPYLHLEDVLVTGKRKYSLQLVMDRRVYSEVTSGCSFYFLQKLFRKGKVEQQDFASFFSIYYFLFFKN